MKQYYIVQGGKVWGPTLSNTCYPDFPLRSKITAIISQLSEENNDNKSPVEWI